VSCSPDSSCTLKCKGETEAKKITESGKCS
jgi:hypothetical protein